MKTINVISTKAGGRMEKSICRSAKWRNLLPSMAVTLIALASCEEAAFERCAPDTLAESVTSERPGLSLMAGQNPGGTVEVLLSEGEGFTTVDLYACATMPFDEDIKVYLKSAGEDFVAEYSALTGTEYKLLPQAFYKFIDGDDIVLREAAEKSRVKQLVIYSKNLFGATLESGRYLLPMTGSSITEELTADRVLIDVTIRQRYTDPDGYVMYPYDDIFAVLYLNTSGFDPRLATDMTLTRNLSYHDENGGYHYEDETWGIGNIVNLLTSTLRYDSVNGKVSVQPSADLKFCLNHYAERILPVQESGRKVCVTIEGGSKGIGFCNLTDSQIEEFAASVKRLVDTYGLDGINLWDRKAAYEMAEENGFPPFNTTSYPTLIKRLRQVLGSSKLLTVTDYEEPTAYFHDVEACGGIEVGRYIDYAWSGYYDNSEPPQIVDPYHQGHTSVSALHPRKPIAGLDPGRYGCLNVTCNKQPGINDTAESIRNWSDGGNMLSNIYVQYDIRSNIQDQFEGNGFTQISGQIGVIKNIYYSQTDNRYSQIYSYDSDRIDNIKTGPGPTNYNKWVKNW